MKIHMPKHHIEEADSVNLKDIPLAYINTNDTVQDIDANISIVCAKDTSKAVHAYDYIDDPDQIFYKSDHTPIENVNLHRSGNLYFYEPQGMTEYSPQTFTARALIKKKLSYDKDKSYNLKVTVIDDDDSNTFSNSMIQIFGDAYNRNVAPKNIKVNGGELNVHSLTTGRYSDVDFVFAHSTDGNEISVGKGATFDQSIASILDGHTNVWLSTDKFGGMYTSGYKEDNGNSKKQHVEFTHPTLYPDVTSYEQTVDSITIFDEKKVNVYFPKSRYKYEFIGKSILILERKNSGYLIVTPTFILNDLKSNVHLVYEVMMYVFLKSYYLSDTMSSWITDEPVDYMAYYARKVNRRHKEITLDSLLQNADYEIGSSYELVDVTVDTEPEDTVTFAGISQNGTMRFLKAGGRPDPQKQDGYISFLTTRLTVINYVQEDVNILESKLMLDYTIVDSVGYITVHPFVSSSLRIHTASDQTLRISDPNVIHYLCSLPGVPEIESTMQLIPFDQYDEKLHGHILATIILKAKRATKLYDISIEGGGLPEAAKDDYNMIDIGNTYGRPYRVGSTMIIRMPKKYKEYDPYIRAAVLDHISSGEYPVFIYE